MIFDWSQNRGEYGTGVIAHTESRQESITLSQHDVFHSGISEDCYKNLLNGNVLDSESTSDS